jgi:hypothetical protein
MKIKTKIFFHCPACFARAIITYVDEDTVIKRCFSCGIDTQLASQINYTTLAEDHVYYENVSNRRIKELKKLADEK